MSERFFLIGLHEAPPPVAGMFDVIALFGDVEPEVVAAILWLRPSLADLDAAHAAWAGRGRGMAALAGTSAAVYQLLAGPAAPNS